MYHNNVPLYKRDYHNKGIVFWVSESTIFLSTPHAFYCLVKGTVFLVRPYRRLFLLSLLLTRENSVSCFARKLYAKTQSPAKTCKINRIFIIKMLQKGFRSVFACIIIYKHKGMIIVARYSTRIIVTKKFPTEWLHTVLMPYCLLLTPHSPYAILSSVFLRVFP